MQCYSYRALSCVHLVQRSQKGKVGEGRKGQTREDQLQGGGAAAGGGGEPDGTAGKKKPTTKAERRALQVICTVHKYRLR